MVPFEQRFYAACKAYHVAVESFQQRLASFVRDTDHIHGPDGLGFRAQAVQIIHHLFLVGDGNVQPAQLRVGVDYLDETIYRRNLEIDVHSIDVLIVELLVEIADREGVPQRVTNKSVLVHVLTLFYVSSAK